MMKIFQIVSIVMLTLLIPIEAKAVTLLTHPDYGLVGAKEVQVNGKWYNVYFYDDMCSLFATQIACSVAYINSYPTVSPSTAQAASAALDSQVFTGIYDLIPSLTRGIESTYLNVGIILTPYAFTNDGYVIASAFLNTTSTNDYIGTFTTDNPWALSTNISPHNINTDGIAAPCCVWAWWHEITDPTISNLPVANAGDDQSVHIGAVATLDGSGSSDPDGDYPLTYAWEVTAPDGSIIIPDPIVNPLFLVNVEGDYTVKLIVTDSQGDVSDPDFSNVSTHNTAPVAYAGDDQSVIEIGTVIQLDGSQSYDDDGDDIEYFWSFVSKPERSIAIISDPTSPIPTFNADANGEYVISLVVSDEFGAVSDPDTITVSFNNVQPSADAGGNDSYLVGDTIYLNGTGSFDANFDPLTYNWSFVSIPLGSLAQFDDPTSGQPSFVADLPGIYIISLVVNDGLINSDPSNVNIVVITYQDATTETLQDIIVATNNIDSTFFKNDNMKNALTLKVIAALSLIDQGFYEDALDKLENDILGKTNGCAKTGARDRNDWIKNCDEQAPVYQLIIEAISLLEAML